MSAEDGHDHRQPTGVDAGGYTSRHGEVRWRYQGLHLQQDRPSPLEHAADRSSDLARMRRTEELRRIRNADEASSSHLEDSELVGRPEPVLRRAEDAVLLVAITFESKDAVDEVLEHTRAGYSPVLGHMSNEDRRDARFLRDTEKPSRRLPHLCDGSRRGAERRGVKGLHRVDQTDIRPLFLESRADGVQLRLGEDLDRVRAAEPGCP